jgi:hypothetical protein
MLTKHLLKIALSLPLVAIAASATQARQSRTRAIGQMKRGLQCIAELASFRADRVMRSHPPERRHVSRSCRWLTRVEMLPAITAARSSSDAPHEQNDARRSTRVSF